MGLNKPIITTETDISGITTVLAEIKDLANTAAVQSTNAAEDAATAKTKASNVDSRLTSTRAGYLDLLANSINGLAAIKTAVGTATTEANNASKPKGCSAFNNASLSLTSSITTLSTVMSGTGSGVLRITLQKSHMLINLTIDGKTIISDNDSTSTIIGGTVKENYHDVVFEIPFSTSFDLKARYTTNPSKITGNAFFY